jgi:hypothetical protein
VILARHRLGHVSSRVAVRIFHPALAAGAGPLGRDLAAARIDLARRHEAAFRRAGADDVEIVIGQSDTAPFGARLRLVVARDHPEGIVVLGSGALALATVQDLREFVSVAGSRERVALANNRHSADAVAVGCAESLLGLPDLPSDNALPRWLAEVAGYEVRDLSARWRLGVDLDSPLDLTLLGAAGHLQEAAEARIEALAAVASDPRAQLVVAGRTSSATIRWLERNVAARVRVLAEERGLRAASALARSDGEASRPPRSVLGLLLDRDGPQALGPLLAELGDAAVVDTRVLVAHRFGADESAWPPAEDRFASDLLLPHRIHDPWLRAVTESALDGPIPIVLGGHTLVGPGLRLALRAGRR